MSCCLIEGQSFPREKCDSTIRSQNVAETILARGDAAAEAVFHKERVVTYAELRRQVAQLARGLLARGHE